MSGPGLGFFVDELTRHGPTGQCPGISPHHEPATGERTMSENITTLTDSSFDEHVKAADGPVLVDFWAEWCGPCKMVAPILDGIASEQAGKLQIAKLNIDE